MIGLKKPMVVLGMLALFASIPLEAPSAQERTSEHHHPFIGRHGGIVEDLGPYNAELVVKGADVSLFLIDHSGRSIRTTDLKANVIVVTGTVRRGSFALSAMSDDKLVGRGPHPGAENLRAVVTLTLPNGTSYQAAYQLHRGSK